MMLAFSCLPYWTTCRETGLSCAQVTFNFDIFPSEPCQVPSGSEVLGFEALTASTFAQSRSQSLSTWTPCTLVCRDGTPDVALEAGPALKGYFLQKADRSSGRSVLEPCCCRPQAAGFTKAMTTMTKSPRSRRFRKASSHFQTASAKSPSHAAICAAQAHICVHRPRRSSRPVSLQAVESCLNGM